MITERHGLSGRFTDAAAYAADSHRDQVRKGTSIPYVAHLLAVASLVLEFGGTETQATAAVLHDVVEDQGGLERLADVDELFGNDVAELVEALSDAAPVAGQPKAPWRKRKEAYLADLSRYVDRGSPAVLVSACDKLHNAESIVADATDPDGDPGLAVFERFTGGPTGTAWYYASLSKIFRSARLPPRLVSRLSSVIDDLVDLAGRAA